MPSRGGIRRSAGSAAVVLLPVGAALWMVELLRVRLMLLLLLLRVMVVVVVHRYLLRGRTRDKRHLHSHRAVCQSA